jgi:hypothetical protein
VTTRYSATPQPNFGVPPLPTGYSSPQADGDLSIPSVGIVDVDRSLFNLFDKEIKMTVRGENTGEGTKVPVVFASGEKWATLKKLQPLRDRNNSLILPLINIVRTGIQQSVSEDITGRGINQQVGELHIRKRLDSTDRSYQSLINRLLIPNQDNLGMDGSSRPDVDQGPIVNRSIGDMTTDPTVKDGGLLLTDRTRDVYETIVVPTPQFFTSLYTVTLWAQYQQHMNQMIESLFASFLPQGRGTWRLETSSGYWFVANVSEDAYTAQNNFEDMSNEERIIKHEFSIRVPAYAFVTDVPGGKVPVRRYVSSSDVSFVISTPIDDVAQDGVDDPFLGSDDPTLPLSETSRRRDLRNDMSSKLFPNSPHVNVTSDPALRGRTPSQSQYKKLTGVDSTGHVITKYVKILKVNEATGEIIYAPATDLGGLTLVNIS